MPELVHTLVFPESSVFNAVAQIYCNYRSTATKKKSGNQFTCSPSSGDGGLPESVRNVPQAPHVLCLRREGANGGRLAVQVEDKLVKVRNVKVSKLALGPASSQERSVISYNGMFITLDQPFPA